MTHIEALIDTSVMVKWYATDNELEVAAAQTIYQAHREGLMTARILDLTVYELGNLLLCGKKWTSVQTSDQLDELLVICGSPLVPAPAWRRDAAELAAEHRLSFCDASFAAAARALKAPLVSADKKLLKTGLAVTATEFVEEHGDHIRKRP